MNSRLTLLFLCDHAEHYAGFVEEFKAAEFQVLIARNLGHAKALLLSRAVNLIVLRHDCSCDDRQLAIPLKRVAPELPIFLLTDQAQPRPADIDSIWRWQVGDEVVTRGMARFFRHLLQTDPSSRRPAPVLVGINSFFAGSRAHGSH